jgi:hypothetical protein
MTAAIFGLLGVIVGGVLNGVVTWRIERARERGDARAAARLVIEELGVARGGFIVYAFRRGRELEFEQPHSRAFDELVSQLHDDAWREHRAILARALDAPGWFAVSTAYHEIAWMRGPGDNDAKRISLSTPAEPLRGAATLRDKMGTR